MKDLDFDELDRAVNSLMAKGGLNSTPPANNKKDDQKVVNLNSTPADRPQVDVAPKMQQPQQPPKDRSPSRDVAPAREVAERPQASAPRSQQVVQRKGSGRFMDIVHETSSMRPPREELSPPSAKPSRYRNGVVRPSPSVSSRSTDVGAPVQPTGDSAATAQATPSLESSSDSEPTTAAMPDPIDFSEGLSIKPDSTEPGAGADNVGLGDPQGDELEPYSPFVPDAKVEKRPLGGAPTSFDISPADTIDESIETKEDLDTAADDQLPPSNETLPPELQSDVVSIESESASVAEEPTELNADAPQSTEAVKAPVTQEAVGTSVGMQSKMGSIPNQYKSEPKTTSDDDESDIFNTDTFSQPLAHPAKRKSGWLTVVVIILLIALGAGLGALVYLYVL